MATLESILGLVEEESFSAEMKHGEQDHLPDGTSIDRKAKADMARDLCESARKRNRLTWKHILHEEVEEAFAEEDPEKLVKELIQVASIAARWALLITNRQLKDKVVL